MLANRHKTTTPSLLQVREIMDITRIDDDSVRFRGQIISREDVDRLYAEMNKELPEKEWEFPCSQDTDFAIQDCKDKFDVCFLGVRSNGEYEDHAFILGKRPGWTIVKDSHNWYLLVREADVILENRMREINLPVHGIRINLTEDGGGSITSDLHEGSRDGEYEKLYDAAIDGIESTILAHAIAGVDVEAPAYLEGIESALEGLVNNFVDH